MGFALNNNYPNPFNPTTQISFDLASESPTELSIFNVFGQRIRTWSYQQRSPGSYSVIWNGRDEGGALVSSGVYLYRLTAGDFIKTRKMTLLR